MLTLTLNAAEQRVQFLLLEDAPLCAQDWSARQGGAELLATALAHACRDLQRPASDIARVACVAGPGAFTGLRLGLATAAGLARANGAKQAGLDYLACLAASVPALPGERLAVLVNAKRGWFYQGLYEMDSQGLPQALAEIAMLPLPQTGTPPPGLPPLHYALGSALSAHAPAFSHILPAGVRLLSPQWDHPTPAALARMTLAVDWENATVDDIPPRYLRPCDAVENLGDPRALAELRRLTNAPWG